MGYTYYKYHVFIPSENLLIFDELVQLFRAYIPSDLTLEAAPNQIILRNAQWSIRVYWETEAYVLEESREFANNPKLSSELATLLATCDRRITTTGDDDPDMDYINDCVFVLEVLNRLENVLRLDLSGQFVNQFGDI